MASAGRNSTNGKRRPKTVSASGLIVFKARYEQLNLIKKQQWVVTNYVALIYGAIFSIKHVLSSSLPSRPPTYEFGLTLLAVSACICGIFLLLNIQRDMGRIRKQIDEANEWIFGSVGEKTETLEGKHIVGPSALKNNCAPYLQGWEFLVGFILVLISGAGLVIYF